MIGSSPNKSQSDAFRPFLSDFLDPDQKLVVLAEAIDWSYFDDAFAGFCSGTGRPAMALRFMVGCQLLKHLCNYGDKTLAKAWVQNPYMPCFCGKAHFQHAFRCDPSDSVHVRKRIGRGGIQKNSCLFRKDAPAAR